MTRVKVTRIEKRTFWEEAPPHVAVRFRVRNPQLTTFQVEGGSPMALVLTVTQQCDASVKYVDAKGNPAQVEGPPKWGASDAAIVAVQAAPDGMSAVIKAVGAIGTGQVSVTADADLGEGVVPLVGTLDVSIVAGQAVAAVISTGTPTEQGGSR